MLLLQMIVLCCKMQDSGHVENLIFLLVLTALTNHLHLLLSAFPLVHSGGHAEIHILLRAAPMQGLGAGQWQELCDAEREPVGN